MKKYNVDSKLKKYFDWPGTLTLATSGAILVMQLMTWAILLSFDKTTKAEIVKHADNSFQKIAIMEIVSLVVFVVCLLLFFFVFRPKDKRIAQQQKDEYLKLQSFMKETYELDLTSTQTENLFHGYRIEIKNDGTEQTSLTLDDEGNFTTTHTTSSTLEVKDKSQKVENNEIKTVLPTKLFN